MISWAKTPNIQVLEQCPNTRPLVQGLCVAQLHRQPPQASSIQMVPPGVVQALSMQASTGAYSFTMLCLSQRYSYFLARMSAVLGQKLCVFRVPDLQVQHPWIWRADCTSLFYIWDLKSLDFGILGDRGTNQSSVGTEGQLIYILALVSAVIFSSVPSTCVHKVC